MGGIQRGIGVLVVLSGCMSTEFDAAVKKGDLRAALAADEAERGDTGVDEYRLRVLAELVLMDAVRAGTDEDARAAAVELLDAGDRGQVVLGWLAEEKLSAFASRVVAAALAGKPLPPTRAPDARAGAARSLESKPLADADLVAALWHRDASVRAHAALRLGVLDARRGLRLALLDRERDPGVLLQLALGLRDAYPQRSTMTLEALLERRGMIGLQAAAELARIGHRRGIERLFATYRTGSVPERVVALRGLARAWPEPRIIPASLHADESAVRIAGAGAILRTLRDR